MKKKLAIFDFDGTLFDTVSANWASYAAALKPYGVSITLEYFIANCYGRYYKEFLPPLLSDPAAIEAVHKEKSALFPRFLGEIRENQALFSLMSDLRPAYHTALVTTAARGSVLAILEHFHRKDMFDLILAQEDVPRKKPAPDGFLLAMEHFGISPENSLIFEDSPEGIAAARAAGAPFLLVKDIL